MDNHVIIPTKKDNLLYILESDDNTSCVIFQSVWHSNALECQINIA